MKQAEDSKTFIKFCKTNERRLIQSKTYTTDNTLIHLCYAITVRNMNLRAVNTEKLSAIFFSLACEKMFSLEKQRRFSHKSSSWLSRENSNHQSIDKSLRNRLKSESRSF